MGTYKENGYEKLLQDLLEGTEYNTILINGEFGSGKTTLLEFVLAKINKPDKVLILKMYEEYIEDNYIDYLYNYLNYKEKKYKKIFKGTIKVYLKNKFGYTQDKIKYNNSQLKKYDYIIIDDLDRVYFNHKETLKMIQYLSENINTNQKIVIVADKDNFVENKLDILEKYYDISFEVPKNLIVQNEIKDFENLLPPIIYKDKIGDVLSIMYKLNIRTTIKVIEHYRMNNIYNEDLINQFYRSDYIFMIILYYKYNNFNSIINTIMDVKEIVDEYSYREENKQEQLDLAVEKINKMQIDKNEKFYLIRCLSYYVDCLEDSGTIKANSTTNIRVYHNRIFDYPLEYKINSFYLPEDNPEVVKALFSFWLENEPNKITFETFGIYKDLIGYDEASIELMGILEEAEDNEKKSYRVFIYDWMLNNEEKLTPNAKHIYLVKRYINVYNDTRNNNIIFDNAKITWENLTYINKLEILEMESFSDTTYFIDKIINDDGEVKKIIEKMIETKRFFNFWKIFKGNIKDFERRNMLIQKIINLSEEYIEERKGLHFGNEDLIKLRGYVDNIKTNYIEVKH